MWRRGALLVVLATAISLIVGLGGWQSEALKPKPRRPAPTPAAHKPTRPDPPKPITVVGLPQAASNAARELAGSGDNSLASWSWWWGEWGRRDAPPGPTPHWHSPAWWQSALDLLALVRYLEQTRDRNPLYEQLIERTFDRNVWLPESNHPINFGNQFMDDTAWWGQAWLEAARYELNVRNDLTLARKYLGVAEWDANYIWRSPRPCHSEGIQWEVGFPPDTITNAEFATLAGGLAQLRKQAGPLQDSSLGYRWASEAWRTVWWLRNSRLINVRTGHVWDTFDANCKKAGGALTYTDGETADALIALALATGARQYLDEAHRFLQYAFAPKSRMVYGGVLQEPCEALPSRCQGGQRFTDATVWKGILVNAVADWRAATGSTEYDRFLTRQAQAVIDNAASDGSRSTACQTPHDCQLGFYWARRVPPGWTLLPVNPGAQESGLSALTDALAVSPR